MAQHTQPRAFVVPASPANGYGTIRSLAAGGIPVVALDHQRVPVRRSRYCAFHQVPDPDRDAQGFVRALGALAAAEPEPPVVIATQDLHVHVLHAHARELEPRIRFPFMAPDAVNAAIDKRLMLEHAREAGLTVPETWSPGSPKDLERLLPRLGRYPYLVKPAAKFEPWAPSRGYRNFAFFQTFQSKALRAESPGRLRDLFARASALGFTLLIQEEIAGPAHRLMAVDFYADAGHRVLASHTGRKIRQWPADFGTCTLGRSSRIPELDAPARRFVKRIGFHGIGNMEFKVRDGAAYFMEINPRPWMWIQMATAAGVNLPLLAYGDLIRRPGFASTAQHGNPFWVDLRMDVHHLGTLGPAAWGRSLLAVRNDARFAVEDPWPVMDALARAVLRRTASAASGSVS